MANDQPCIVSIKEKHFTLHFQLWLIHQVRFCYQHETGLTEILQFDITDWRKLDLKR